jgi:hypothetical protein
MAKKPHHAGTYHRRAIAVRAAANADPATRCWRCGRTKAQHKREWTAGHAVAGVVNGQLLPECAECNYRHGALMKNGRLKPTPSRIW